MAGVGAHVSALSATQNSGLMVAGLTHNVPTVCVTSVYTSLAKSNLLSLQVPLIQVTKIRFLCDFLALTCAAYVVCCQACTFRLILER